MDGKKVSVLILAGGQSVRMRGINKQFVLTDGIPVIIKSVMAFEYSPFVNEIIIAAGKDDINRVRCLCEKYGIRKLKAVVPGGDSRAASAANAAAQVSYDTDIIAVHDGARPYVTADVIRRVTEAAAQYGAAVPAVPVKDTVRVADGGFSAGTPDRSTLRLIQTPQAFSADIYRKMLDIAAGMTALAGVTDDAGLAEAAGYKVFITEGDERNIKITTPEDIPAEPAEACRAAVLPDIRVGHGYDVHRLTENRKLILGGVDIPYEKGLLGHSDADVLVHAVMDALLGAAALGDIGKHFPDSDDRYSGADSIMLLKEVCSLVKLCGYRVSSIDATIQAEKPKLSVYITDMRRNIATACETDISRVSVKATTQEGLGLAGEGIGAHCVAVISDFR